MYGDDPYGMPAQAALQRQRTSGGPYGMDGDQGAAIQKAMDDLQQMIDEQKRRMAEQQAAAQGGGSKSSGGGGIISKLLGGGDYGGSATAVNG